MVHVLLDFRDGRSTVRCVVHLRLVEEYRGRRIVTNGTMYGIEGELITDCRYLNVAGARAAIDSELAIRQRKQDQDWQRERIAAHLASEGQDWAYACDCGWRGTHAALKKTGAPLFFSCPACSSCSLTATATSGEPDEPSDRTNAGRMKKKRKNKPAR